MPNPLVPQGPGPTRDLAAFVRSLHGAILLWKTRLQASSSLGEDARAVGELARDFRERAEQLGWDGGLMDRLLAVERIAKDTPQGLLSAVTQLQDTLSEEFGRDTGTDVPYPFPPRATDATEHGTASFVFDAAPPPLLDQSSIHQGVAGKVKTLEATAGLGAKASGDVLRVMGPIRARSATTQAKTDAMTAPAPKAPEMPVRKTPTTKSSDVAPKATKGLYFEKASSAFLEEDGTTNRNVPTMVRPEAPPSSPENPPPRLNLHAFRESEGTLPPDSTPSELVASQASGGLPRIHGETSSGQGLLGSTTPKDMPLDRRSVRAPKWFYGLLVVLALIVLATAVLTLVRSRQAFEPVSKEAK